MLSAMYLSKRSSLFRSSLNRVIHINVINMIILWGRARVFTNLYQECKANFSQFKTEIKSLKRKKGLGLDMGTNIVNVKSVSV